MPLVAANSWRGALPADGMASSDTHTRVKASEATVVIATYDLARWDLLAAAVTSIESDSDQPAQVIVSVDQNEALYERIRTEWPEITVVRNAYGRGASGTRNTAAELACTPYIVFVDDDIRVRPGWLERLLQPFVDPTVVGTGGGVVPRWQGSRPSWFPEEFDWVVGASYRGMPTAQDVVRNVWSENMAVRAEVFQAVGGFRSDFGKIGNYNSPEDTDLCIRMAGTATGLKWVYVPAALVEHHVPAVRSSFSYFLKRNYREGVGKVRMADLIGKQETLRSERNYLRRTLPSGILAGLWRPFRHGDLRGFLQAGSIVAGVLAAGIGAIAATRDRSRQPGS